MNTGINYWDGIILSLALIVVGVIVVMSFSAPVGGVILVAGILGLIIGFIKVMTS